jgi:hypothetical protein
MLYKCTKHSSVYYVMFVLQSFCSVNLNLDCEEFFDTFCTTETV